MKTSNVISETIANGMNEVSLQSIQPRFDVCMISEKKYNRIKSGLFECDFKLERNGLERQQIIITFCWQMLTKLSPERRSVSFKNKLKVGFVQRSSVFSSVTQQFRSKHYMMVMNSQNYQLLHIHVAISNVIEQHNRVLCSLSVSNQICLVRTLTDLERQSFE